MKKQKLNQRIEQLKELRINVSFVLIMSVIATGFIWRYLEHNTEFKLISVLITFVIFVYYIALEIRNHHLKKRL